MCIFFSNIHDCGILVKASRIILWCLTSMYARSKRVALLLFVVGILFSSALVGIRVVHSAPDYVTLDLFTQQTPYSGIGPNGTSDAFGPGESVEIYALILYKGYPVPNIAVAFEIRGPPDPIKNITLYRTAFTNGTGLALVCVRVPYVNEAAFGYWLVIGNAMVEDVFVQDFLTFRAGWIVEIVSIRTIDANRVSQEKFTKDHDVGVELGVKSISFTPKVATLTVSLVDALGLHVNSAELNGFVVPANETLVYAYFSLYVPMNASLGVGRAYGCAYTKSVDLGGVPYCPEVSKSYSLISHDVAVVGVTPSPMSVYVGDRVHVDVAVRNYGSEVEGVNVTAYRNGTVIGSRLVSGLQAFSSTVVGFDWDTDHVAVGKYSISAHVAPVFGEVDVDDNTFVDGFVEVKSRPPMHDVAVVSVASASNLVYVGDIVDVFVGVKNFGNFTESFNVTAFYGSNAIGTLFVNGLESSAGRTLTFYWNTQGVAEGTYALTGLASAVSGEVNLDNNRYSDGIVRVVARPQPAHDVAVLNVVPASRLVAIGDILSVNVTVKNKGTVSESFDVVLYYMQRDQRVAGTMRVDNLAAGTQYVLVFSWDTTRVSAGNYTLIGYAQPVAGETKMADNWVEDGTVRIFAGPRSEFVPDWFFWFFLILLLLRLLAILLLWLYYRRRKRKSEASFYSGWTAWYYGHDLRGKSHDF